LSDRNSNKSIFIKKKPAAEEELEVTLETEDDLWEVLNNNRLSPDAMSDVRTECIEYARQKFNEEAVETGYTIDIMMERGLEPDMLLKLIEKQSAELETRSQMMSKEEFNTMLSSLESDFEQLSILFLRKYVEGIRSTMNVAEVQPLSDEVVEFINREYSIGNILKISGGFSIGISELYRANDFDLDEYFTEKQNEVRFKLKSILTEATILNEYLLNTRSSDLLIKAIVGIVDNDEDLTLMRIRSLFSD